ncbi:hypothetical protein CERSUDRAFT_115287 [Gelatoporia subvermispora B]|uniref:Uncharacterized protein n=1 Tax=Ceriporiopsis subvermispora (strain B) TaxID=914234 RepID=M2RC19_CERS8|nr:hypothetical protein CERSUDRAFT_115287 [Gelatoporia subvermispora B]
MPDTLLYVAFYHQLSGLLLNAFLATYNARRELRQAASGHGELVPIQLSHMAAASDARATPKNGRTYGDRKIQIAVDTSTNTQFDG